jgi:hypothetical protein
VLNTRKKGIEIDKGQRSRLGLLSKIIWCLQVMIDLKVKFNRLNFAFPEFDHVLNY